MQTEPAEMLNPKITVIVLKCNGLRFLRDCFRSLARIAYSNHEVMPADKNSTDGSVKCFNAKQRHDRVPAGSFQERLRLHTGANELR